LIIGLRPASLNLLLLLLLYLFQSVPFP